MANYVLGLDLGGNSIGWAMVDEESRSIINTGVRIFPAGVANFDTAKEMSKNESRRIARGMRRQTARRSKRKHKLRAALTESGLLPADPEQFQSLIQSDPYQLRRKALDEQLTLFEIGRVLLHLNQRRGFLSNRKTDRERKAETKGMLDEISELSKAIHTSGSRTLGEYLATLHSEPENKLRKRHTRRDMYEEEFELIWKSQRRYYSDVLTDQLKFGTQGKQGQPKKPQPLPTGSNWLNEYGVYGLMFFQRKMYWPKSVVGRCELEPRRRRCPRADRIAQRFRLLQEVNNLRYIDLETGEICNLSEEHRTLLLDKLATREKMSFDKIRDALGFLDTIEFNLETGGRKFLQGMITDWKLANKKIFGKTWHEKDDEEKNAIVRSLIHRDDAEVYNLATNEWGLSDDAADNLLDVELPSGYLHLSQCALNKLLPPMERGLLYMQDDDTPSALSEAGYLRPDQVEQVVCESLPNPPQVTNPVVRQALFEVRKVVNSIIKEYGKPARIHVELARNAKASSEDRKTITKRMRDREAARDAAAASIREFGTAVTRDAIDRYLLWQDQRQVCIYSGRPISLAQLLGGEVDVDHILPYRRCLDDSFANKVVCFRNENADKGDRTPFEWLGESQPEQLEDIRQRARPLPFNKKTRLTQKTLDLDKFISRQLNDTRYISRVVVQYVQTLFDRPQNVVCVRGDQTATLRRCWGLNTILRLDNEDVKNRDDHRHHAVDAIVLAMTNRSRLHLLAKNRRFGSGDPTTKEFSDPWQGFRSDVEDIVNTINVSYRVCRKVSGKLHEDSVYGPTETKGTFVIRKPLTDLTPAMIEDIRDDRIKQLVKERLDSSGVVYGSRSGVKKIPGEVWEQPLYLQKKSGSSGNTSSIVKKVRVTKRDETIRPIRNGKAHVKPGSTHHVCIFRKRGKDTDKYFLVSVSMLEAIQRIKEEKSVIQHTCPNNPEAVFIMSLSQNELLLLTIQGAEQLYRYGSSASTTEQMTFYPHNASQKWGKMTKYPNSLMGLQPRKVTVDALGNIRWAND